MSNKCADCQHFKEFVHDTEPAVIFEQLSFPQDAEVAVTLIAAMTIRGNGLRTCENRGIGPGCLICPISAFVPRT